MNPTRSLVAVLRSGPVMRVGPLVGAAATVAGLVIIWVARLSVHRAVYVSELGATGMPTAGAFAIALLLVAGGGLMIAVHSAHLRSQVPWLALWKPAVTLAVASCAFVITSQVPCSYNCPVPLVDPRAGVADLVHVVSAVLGFGAACFAMLQVATLRTQRALAIGSTIAGATVATITAVGGLLSIAGRGTDVGAWLEFAGMTIAVGWIAAYGCWLAVGQRPPARASSSASASRTSASI